MSTGPFIPGVGVQLAGGSIYVGPLHPWLTPIEESDGMLHPFDAGSFKRWAMQSHYEILTLRGLANKKYVTSTDPKLNSLVALPNEVLCHVLGYWKETLPRLYDLNPAGRARLQN